MRRCALLASRSPMPSTRRSARRSRRSSPGSAGGCTSAPRRSRSRPASCSSRSRRPRRPGSARACTSSPRCCSSPSRPSTTAATGRPGRTASCRRFDHANIFLLIAGSYTPFALVLLEGGQRMVLLSDHLVGGRARRAVQGVLDRCAASGSTCRSTSAWAGRRCSTSRPLPQGSNRLGVGIGTAILVLIDAGGALYTLGGVVYSIKRPDPWPRWFGFHEIFHTLHDPGVRDPLRRHLDGDYSLR